MVSACLLKKNVDMLPLGNSIYLLRKFDIICFTNFDMIQIPCSRREATYRAERHIACKAHIENSKGIYIATECSLEHSVWSALFLHPFYNFTTSFILYIPAVLPLIN